MTSNQTTPEKTSSGLRVIAGVEIVFDEEGFLKNPSLWNEEIAGILAQEAGIPELNDRQWMILRFLRKFYAEQGKSPMNHHIKNGTGISLMELEALFPGGIKYGARRLAGLPNPKGCK